MRMTRQQLYVEIWTTSLKKVASRLKTSVTHILRICRDADIPVPTYRISIEVKNGARTTAPRLPTHKQDAARDVEIIPREKIDAPAISVAQSLERTHPLVEKLGKHLAAQRVDKEDNLVGASWDRLDVRVAPASVPRALLIMDALLKEFDARNWKIRFSEGLKKTFVNVAGADIGIKLRERVKRSKLPQGQKSDSASWPNHIFTPNGEFRLKFDGHSSIPRTEWADNNGKRVEEQLGEFVAWLQRAGELQKDRDCREAEESRIARLLYARRQTANECYELGLQHKKTLEDLASKYEYASRIWALVRAAKAVDFPDAASLQKWSAWASEHANTLDPLGNGSLQKLVSQVVENQIRMVESQAPIPGLVPREGDTAPAP